MMKYYAADKRETGCSGDGNARKIASRSKQYADKFYLASMR